MDSLVYVIDDDAAVRDALALLVRSVQLRVQAFCSGQTFLEALGNNPTSRQRCLVTDVRMPGMSGLDLQAELGRRNIYIPIIVISAHADVPLAVRAMRAGARMFLEKPVNEQELIDAIHQCLLPQAGNATAQPLPVISELRAKLTERQTEVFDQLIKGLQTKEVAKQLGLSHRTVEVHRANILERLNIQSFSHLLQRVLAQSGPH